MKKLDTILLIDDDAATNYLHQMLIEESNCANKVSVAKNGKEALNYLSSDDKEAQPKPDLIFLDINMPVMNGWEFLDQYVDLPDQDKGKIVIVMLTTSLNPDDRKMAEKYSAIKKFQSKPLNVENLEQIISDYFSD